MPAPAVSESPPPPPPVPPAEAQQPAETPPTPPPPEAPAEQPKKAEAAPTDTPTLESDLPGLLSMQKPVEKPSKPPPEPQKDAVEETSQPEQKSETKRPAKTPSKPKQQRTAKLDLSPPPQTFSAPQAGGGRSASFSRPPGITRSGWNDDFARGVIRALQQTMPQLREILGRVTVRILLTENGNVRDVQLVRPSSNSSLDQSVIFAARQTSYPLPPAGATVADRTFVVTYVYR
jgi:TonB family protein